MNLQPPVRSMLTLQDGQTSEKIILYRLLYSVNFVGSKLTTLFIKDSLRLSWIGECHWKSQELHWKD